MKGRFLVGALVLLGGVAHAGPVDDLLSRSSLEEKVGQVLMITAGGAKLGPAATRLLRQIRPGGLTLFGYHLKDPARIAALTASMREAVGPIPPFVAVDHEGGAVVRLKVGVPRLPGGPVLGAAADPGIAERVGRLVGAGLRALGFNMNLAPVLDVPRAGGGRYLRARAFSDDAVLVGRLGAAFVRGLQASGVAAVGKHFPGEGTSRGDPHRGLQAATAEARELRAVDLTPFREARPDAVMVGHVSFPRLDRSGRPASLSAQVYQWLRREGGFEGPALTDGLEMRAIRGRFGLAQAAVEALRAGADMVSIFWSPARIREVRSALLRAVVAEVIPRARLDEAVRRVLEAKHRRGLLEPGSTTPAVPAGVVRQLLVDLGRAAARRVRGEDLAPPEAPVLSRVPGVLRAAGARGVDLRTLSPQEAIRRAKLVGTAVLVGGARDAALARALSQRGVRVVAVVSMPPRSARRFPAQTVVAAWETGLLQGALAATLEGRALKASTGRAASSSGSPIPSLYRVGRPL